MITEINSATKANLIQSILETLEKPLQMTEMKINREDYYKKTSYQFTLKDSKFELRGWLEIKDDEKKPETKSESPF